MKSEIVIPIIVALIAALPGLFALRGQVRKDSADVASKYEELLSKQIHRCEEMQTQLDELTAKLDNYEDVIRKAQWRIKRLEAQLVAAGMEPVAA